MPFPATPNKGPKPGKASYYHVLDAYEPLQGYAFLLPDRMLTWIRMNPCISHLHCQWPYVSVLVQHNHCPNLPTCPLIKTPDSRVARFLALFCGYGRSRMKEATYTVQSVAS